jgi:exodeoxyribonuclease V beta subunit
MFIFKKNKNSVFDLLGKNCNHQLLGQLYIDTNKISIINRKIEIQYQPLNLGQQTKNIQKDNENLENIKAKYFGIATHYCLEMMNKFDQDSLDKSFNIITNKYSDMLNNEDFDDIYNRIKLLINDTKFQMMVNNCEYFKEQTLIFDEHIKIIDLLLKQKDKYIICDYKTTIAQKDEHISQVQLYQKAIRNITKTDDVKAFVIYLQKEKITILEVKY